MEQGGRWAVRSFNCVSCSHSSTLGKNPIGGCLGHLMGLDKRYSSLVLYMVTHLGILDLEKGLKNIHSSPESNPSSYTMTSPSFASVIT